MNLKAQTWQEWFRQKETQKDYLLRQIASLKLYIDYAEQGYRIAAKGLHTIYAFKKGDFRLHHDFFSSLEQINPSVKSCGRVADIILIQIKIERQIREAVRAAERDGALSPAEMDYCVSVLDKLRADCLQNLDQLLLFTTGPHLQMTDGERLREIEALFSDMKDKYLFAFSFADQMKLLSVQRNRSK